MFNLFCYIYSRNFTFLRKLDIKFKDTQFKISNNAMKRYLTHYMLNKMQWLNTGASFQLLSPNSSQRKYKK